MPGPGPAEAPPPTWVAHVERTFNAIGWSGLASSPIFGCIEPPPFGKQCTLPRAAAVAACMAMEGCIGITCPDPRESHIGTRGITGPICQLRSSRTANEKGHGMCRPEGCINIGLSRIPRPLSLHNWRSLGAAGNVTLSRPALLIVHGDTSLLTQLLVPGIGRYWPLRPSSAGIPSTGLLFAVDALPPGAHAVSSRRAFRRHDLWMIERAGGSASAGLPRPYDDGLPMHKHKTGLGRLLSKFSVKSQQAARGEHGEMERAMPPWHANNVQYRARRRRAHARE